MAAYGQTQYSPALQPPGPYAPYAHHAQGYSVPSYSECEQIFIILPFCWCEQKSEDPDLEESCVRVSCSDQLVWWNFRVLYVSDSNLIVNLPTTGLNLAEQHI